nr:beta-N-acetylhexosaminidase [Gracilibacillus alcaliphilus]
MSLQESVTSKVEGGNDVSGIDKKIGRLMVIGFHGTEVTDEVKHLIHTYHVAGIILFSRNINYAQQLKKLITALQQEAQMAGYQRPLLICLDQENGIVRRLGDDTTIFPGSMAIAATEAPDNAFQISYATGEELRALGINWNLAPVLDINNNQHNPVIGVRSFSDSPDQVSAFGQQAMKGMQAAGIIPTLKHFPGHGDTQIDSHLGMATLTHNMERLEQIELKPFRTCIEAGAEVVMTAHIHFSTMEPQQVRPATVSKRVLTDILRNQLGFQGVITTDCLEMEAISDTIGTENGAVQAVQAGADLVMISHTYEKQIGAAEMLHQAVKTGELSHQRMEQSVQRVNRLIDKYTEQAQSQAFDSVGSSSHQQLAYQVYQQSVTIIRNNKQTMPFAKWDPRVLVIEAVDETGTKAEDETTDRILIPIVREFLSKAEAVTLPGKLSLPQVNHMIKQAEGYDYIIFGTMNLTPDSRWGDLIQACQTKKTKVVGIAMKNPYDVRYFPTADAYLCTYEPTYPAIQIAVQAIIGEVDVKGKLPVHIST